MCQPAPVRPDPVPDGLHDLPIPGTPTQDPSDGVADLCLRRIGRAFEHVLGGHQHARCADPTLSRTRFQERPLQVPEVGELARCSSAAARAHPFDRPDLAAANLRHRHQAGTRLLPVDPDGAGAAVPGVAADLRPGQPQIVAEHIGEPPHRLDLDVDRSSIDLEAHPDRHATSSSSARRTRVSAASRR